MRFLRVLLSALLAAISATGMAGEIIFEQGYDGSGAIGPINKSITPGQINAEAADDFDIVGRIEGFSIQPQRSYPWSAPPPVDGVTVRFYSWNNGVPGTLQASHFLTPGPNLYISESWQMERIDVTLPEVFHASGKHFVSVQIHTDEPFNWYTSNSYNFQGARAQVRDLKVSNAWSPAPVPADLTLVITGVLQGTPVITKISDSTLPKSGRLIIEGKYFGGVIPQVTIGGVQAIVTGWNSKIVKAYVPEATNLGTASVQVHTEFGPTNEVPITVTQRSSEGRIKWKFKIDNAYTQDVPIVGPDGTIFVTTGYAIYALTPDGGLKWFFGDIPYVDRIDVGPDGTLYTSCNDWVFALDGETGAVKWKYDPPFEGNWPNSMGGPNVGPDGNIYVAHVFEGIYSLTPEGRLRWKYPHKVSEYKATSKRIVFTPGKMHVTIAHEDNGTTSPYMDELLTLSLDGKFLWRQQYVSTASPAANPLNGDIYTVKLTGLTALTNNGSIRWQDSASTTPTVGTDGKVYAIKNYGRFHVAFDPANGSTLWVKEETNHNFELHHPTQKNSVLMGAGQRRDGGDPGTWFPYLQALSPTTGATLWRQYIPHENTNPEYPTWGYIQPNTPTISNDGTTAYYGSFHNADYGVAAYTYVYAVSTGEGSSSTPPNLGSEFVSQVVPSTMTAGERTPVKITLKNNGSTSWAAGTHWLAPIGTAFGPVKVNLPAGTTVAPGATYTFSFQTIAPTSAGTYNMNWQMKTANGGFGQTTPTATVAVTVKNYAAVLISQTIPTTVKKGAAFTVTIKMRNVGTVAWTNNLGVMLASRLPDLNTTWGPSKVAFGASESIAPGTEKTFTISCVAPSRAGTYKMQWQMRREGSITTFFGDPSNTKSISVTN